MVNQQDTRAGYPSVAIRRQRGAIAILVAAMGIGLIGIFALQISVMYLLNKKRDSRRAAEFVAQTMALNYISRPGRNFGNDDTIATYLHQQINANSPGAVPVAPALNRVNVDPLRLRDQGDDIPGHYYLADGREFQYQAVPDLAGMTFMDQQLFPTVSNRGRFAVPNWQTRMFYPVPVSIAIVLDQSANMALNLPGTNPSRTFDRAIEAARKFIQYQKLEGRVNWSFVSFSENIVLDRQPITNANLFVGDQALNRLNTQRALVDARINQALAMGPVKRKSTDIKEAIDRAVQLLNMAPNPDNNELGGDKFIVLISDGIAVSEDNSAGGGNDKEKYRLNIESQALATAAAAQQAKDQNIRFISVFVEQLGKDLDPGHGQDIAIGKRVMEDIAMPGYFLEWNRSSPNAIDEFLRKIDPLNTCVSDIPGAPGQIGPGFTPPNDATRDLVFGYLATRQQVNIESPVVRVNSFADLLPPQGAARPIFGTNDPIPEPIQVGGAPVEKRFIISPLSRRIKGNGSFCTKFLPSEITPADRMDRPIFRMRWGWPIPCSNVGGGICGA